MKASSLVLTFSVDETAFTSCLNNEAKKAEAEENMNMAQRAGVRKLPALLVGGFRIEGCRPLDTYIQAIETVLTTQSPG